MDMHEARSEVAANVRVESETTGGVTPSATTPLDPEAEG